MKYLLTAFTTILLSCQGGDVVDLVVSQDNGLGSLDIEVDSTLVDGGQLVSFKMELDGTDYLYRSRPFAGAIQSINVANGSVECLNFPKEGPNGIRRIQSFLIKEDGSYYVAADERIVLFNKQGHLQEDFKIYPNNIDAKLDGPYVIRATHEYPLQQYNDELIVHLERDDSDNHSFPYHYQGAFLGALSVKDKETVPLPIYWPEQDQYYGYIHRPFFSVVDGKIVYGFSFSPDLNRFSLETESNELLLQPEFNGQRNEAFTGSFDEVELLGHRARSVMYGRLIYDKQSKQYCQVLFVPPNSSHPMYGLAQFIGVRLFDENLKLLGETILPRGMAPEAYFIDGELYVRHLEGIPENVFSLRKISLAL